MVNIDAMPESELVQYVKQARAGLLRDYAQNKLAAVRKRLRGDILAASAFEQVCERIYGRLPARSRW